MDLAQIIKEGGTASYLAILIAGPLATEIWRWAGVLVGARINENSEVLKWVRAVSNALVAGLIGRMLIFPVGALAACPIWIRLGAFALGVFAYFIAGRHFALGIFTGLSTLILAQLLFV